MIRRWWTATTIEWFKWRRQWLPWTGLVCSVLVAILGALGAVRGDLRRVEREGRDSYPQYVNPNGYSIQTGDSAATDEMCLAMGYYFPSAGGDGRLCFNSTLVN